MNPHEMDTDAYIYYIDANNEEKLPIRKNSLLREAYDPHFIDHIWLDDFLSEIVHEIYPMINNLLSSEDEIDEIDPECREHLPPIYDPDKIEFLGSETLFDDERTEDNQ